MADNDIAKPLSLRDEDPQPAPAPSSGGPTQIVYLVITAAVFLVVGLLIAFAVSGNNDNQIDKDELRDTVREVVSTEIAGLAPIQVNENGTVNQAALDEMVNRAVSTQVAALQPTATLIPPTPTPIPISDTVENDAFLGPADAPVTIVEFADFQCGYCRRWAVETLPQILAAFPDEVKFVYRDFPIFGDDSVRAAMATECAREQNDNAFWDMHNLLYEKLGDSDAQSPLSEDSLVSYADELGLDGSVFRECLVSTRYINEVSTDYQAAVNWGFGGTPGFVINGVVYRIGAQPFDVFEDIIRSALETAGS